MSEEIDLIILNKVNDNGTVNTYDLCKECDKDHQLFVGAVKRLQSLGNVRYV